MESPTYTLRDIAREMNLPESTIRYYRDAFSLYVPSVGLGRRRRYLAAALDVFRAIVDAYSQGWSREDVEARLAENGPVNEPAPARPTALRLHRHAVSMGPSDELIATMLEGERERREVMWQLAREIVRMGEVLERQQLALMQISQHLDRKALGPGAPGGPLPIPYPSAVPEAPDPTVPDEEELARQLEALRDELARERELVDRLRRSKLEIERRATAAEAELQQQQQQKSGQSEMGALRKFLSRDR